MQPSHSNDSVLTSVRDLQNGGAKRDRTVDLLRARQALSQLSYSPIIVVGQGRLELPTSPLSGVRSNQLSYRPGNRCLPSGAELPTLFTRGHSLQIACYQTMSVGT